MTKSKEFCSIHKRKMLEVFKVFIDICEKYKLMEFFHRGLTIGEKGHKGFIPWDDDIDVLMPRQSYERFLALFSSLIQNGCKLVVPKDESSYYLPFA